MWSLWYDFKQGVLGSKSWIPKLVALNILIYLLFIIAEITAKATGSYNLYNYLYSILAMPANPSEFIFKPWTIITYSFVHVNLWHLIFNMLALYWFGKIFELFLMYRYTLRLYVIGAVSGGLIFLVAYNLLPALSTHATLIGASASVMAFLLADTTISPRYPLHLLFLGRVELRFVALAFIILDILFLGFSNTGGHLAHLGGAFAGFMFVKWLKRPTHKSYVPIRFKRKKKPKKAPVDEEIDRILDKIRQEGIGSLTDKERRLLDEYSKRIARGNEN